MGKKSLPQIVQQGMRIAIYFFLCGCVLSCIPSIAAANAQEANAGLEEQIVSKPEKILPLKRFLLFPVDPEGLPPGVGSELQIQLEQAFQVRFSAVDGFYLKTLVSYPDMERAHPRNKSFWIDLAKEKGVDACIYVRNEAYFQPDFVEQMKPYDIISKGPKQPGSKWRIILIDGATGEILWNNSWSAMGGSKRSGFGSEVKDAFPELAEMIVQNWPIHPQQWDLKTGVMLGRQLPQKHYGNKHISFAGVMVSEFIPKDMPDKIKVVFLEDVKKLTYVISLPTEKTRTVRIEWYAPGKKLVRSKKHSSSFGPYIFDFLNLEKEAADSQNGIWEIKVWEKEELLDYQLFQVGGTAQPVNGS